MEDPLSQKLDNIMDKANISVKEIADNAGISVSKVRAIREGDIRPTEEEILKISAALNISPEALRPSMSLHILEGALQIDEQMLVESYRKLNAEQKKKALSSIMKMQFSN